MNWLYVSILLINNMSTIDYTIVNTKEECITKHKNKIAVTEQMFPSISWKLSVKCFPLDKGVNI